MSDPKQCPSRFAGSPWTAFSIPGTSSRDFDCLDLELPVRVETRFARADELHSSQLLVSHVPQPLVAELGDLSLQRLVEMDSRISKLHSNLINHAALLEREWMHLICDEKRRVRITH
jgi:hypothetical protein